MKKSILLIATCLFFTAQTFAQSGEANSKRINLGAGIMEETTFLGLNVDYAVANNIFLGTNFYFHSKESFTTLYPTLRGSYYFNKLLNLKKDNIDLYAGLGVSKVFVLYSGESTSSEVFIPIHAGGRYFFNDKLGIHAEIVLSNKIFNTNVFNLGISFKR